MLRVASRAVRSLSLSGRRSLSLPAHDVVGMPALSPTMESVGDLQSTLSGGDTVHTEGPEYDQPLLTCLSTLLYFLTFFLFFALLGNNPLLTALALSEKPSFSPFLILRLIVDNFATILINLLC